MFQYSYYKYGVVLPYLKGCNVKEGIDYCLSHEDDTVSGMDDVFSLDLSECFNTTLY